MNRMMLFSVISIIVISSCNVNKKGSLRISNEVVMDSIPGECPYLTKDNKGNMVLSWVRMINDSTTSFCYAIAKDGKGFDKPLIIPNTGNIHPHGENLPRIIFKPSGEIIALWGAGNANPRNKYSGLVYYVQSFDEGKTWTNARSLISDTASYDQRYYDVAVLASGEAGIVWLDNRKTVGKEGSALYFAQTNGREGFTGDHLISQLCCQCCRTDLLVDSKGNVHALYRGIIQDSIRDMMHIVSTDGGKTFSSPQRISNDNWTIKGCPHTGPAMAETKEGLQFAWFTGGDNKGSYYSCSKNNGVSFSPRSSVSENGSHPQIAAISGNETVLVWDEIIRGDGKSSKVIGIQRRTGQQVNGKNEFITADTATASYPVVLPGGGNLITVAYSLKLGDKNFVAYRIVEFRK